MARGIIATLVAVAAVLGGCSTTGPSGGDGEHSVILVLTNHGTIGDTGEPTGFYLPEAAHPWGVFEDAGWSVTLASPAGGPAPIDPRSLEDIDTESQAFLEAYAQRGTVPDTEALGDLDWRRYDAVFFAGGHGTMWDFPDHPAVQGAAARIYEQSGVVAAVCHGPAALVNARADGSWLLDGRRATGFTNSEERAVDLADEMPFLLETRMRERGAEFEGAHDFERKVVTDGRVVTGQNPASARAAAVAVVDLVESK